MRRVSKMYTVILISPPTMLPAADVPETVYILKID